MADPSPKPRPAAVTIRLTTEDEEIIAFLQKQMGIMAATEVFRAALRAQRREVERSTGVVLVLSTVAPPAEG